MNEAKDICTVCFSMKVDAPSNYTVLMCGDHDQLGNWEPINAHALKLNEKNFWESIIPLKLEINKKIQFKCVILNDKQEVFRWEKLPNDSNRKYKARYPKVILKGTENDSGGKEIVENIKNNHEKTELESSPPPDKKPKKRETSNSIHIDINTKVRKGNMDDGFNPFSFAELSDSGSEERNSKSSSLFSLEDSQDLDKIRSSKKKNTELIETIAEKPTPKSPLSINSEENPKKQTKENQQEINEFLEKKLQELKAKETKQKSKKIFDFNPKETFQSIYEKMKNDLVLMAQENSTNNKNIVQTEFMSISQLNIEITTKESIIIVSRFLPLRITGLKGNRIIKIDENMNLINLTNNLYHSFFENFENTIFVGWLQDVIDDDEIEEIEKICIEKFRCYPIFLNELERTTLQDLHSFDEITLFDVILNNFYYTSQSFQSIWSKRNHYWNVLTQINKDFGLKIQNIMKENSLIFIIDYPLVLVPIFLIQSSIKISISIYCNIDFPSFENFRLIPYKEEILNGFLSVNLITFNDYEQMREFFTSISILKGINIETHKGLLFITYMGRKISIKIRAVTSNYKRIEKIKETKEFEDFLKLTIEKNQNFNIGLSIDSPCEINGLEIKFNFFYQYVIETKNVSNLKLIQIILKNPYQSLLKTNYNYEYNRTIKNLANTLNEKYKETFKKTNNLIELIYEDLSENELLSLMTISKFYLKSSIKNDYNIEIMSFICANRNFGYLLISDFIHPSKVCSTIISFNPLKYAEFREKMDYILTVNSDLTNLIQLDDNHYLLKNDIDEWIKFILKDFKIQSAYLDRISLIDMPKNENLLFSKIRITDNFKHLEIDTIIDSYKKSNNRIILLDYEGTLVTYDNYTCLPRNFNKDQKISLKPSDTLIQNLKKIANDLDNNLYIITGNKADCLDDWFGNVLNIGLAAEYGYFLKVLGKIKWSVLFSMDWSWKEVVKKIFENYKRNTDGSEIEIKESCMTFKFHSVQQDFAKKQTEALAEHLKSSLEYFQQIEIFKGEKYLEVRPLGMNKGTMTELLIRKVFLEKGKIDFLLCIGDGLSDEKMFKTVLNHIKEYPEDFEDNFQPFLCSVGKKTSFANYYLEDVEEVGNLLKKLKEIIDY